MRQALLDHGVIFFRGQHITTGQHWHFDTYFGVPMSEESSGSPQDTAANVMHADLAPTRHATAVWHADTTSLARPPWGTTLRAVQLPALGGDTCWSSAQAAFEALSPRWQAMLDGLTAVHAVEPLMVRMKDFGPIFRERFTALHDPSQVHPVVLTHPESGRRGLFVNEAFTTRILELEPRRKRRGAAYAVSPHRFARFHGALALAAGRHRLLGQPFGPALCRAGLRQGPGHGAHRARWRAAGKRTASQGDGLGLANLAFGCAMWQCMCNSSQRTVEFVTNNAGSVADAKTLPQLIRAAAAAYGDELAITLKGDTIPDDAASFRELESRSNEIARGLIARGVGKGSRVGFICGNGPFFAMLLAAIGRIGAVVVPISTLIKANELVRVLRQSDVSCLIVQRSFLGNDYVERLCDALPELRSAASPELRIARTPFLRWIATSGDDLPATIHGMDYLTDAAGSVSEELLREAEAEVHPTDQLIEIYTSGSMALPKGVKHNHGPAMFRAHFMTGIIGLQRGKEYNCMLPMFWVGGLMMSLLPNWEAGAVTVCSERTLSNSRMAMGSVLTDDDLAAMSKPAQAVVGAGHERDAWPLFLWRRISRCRLSGLRADGSLGRSL